MEATQETPVKNNFMKTCGGHLAQLKINLTFEEISRMSQYKFKQTREIEPESGTLMQTCIYIVLKRRWLKLQVKFYLNQNLKLNHDRNLKPNWKQNYQHVIFVSWLKATAARSYAQFQPCFNVSKLKFITELFLLP